jgi:hypothetical protein
MLAKPSVLPESKHSGASNTGVHRAHFGKVDSRLQLRRPAPLPRRRSGAGDQMLSLGPNAKWTCTRGPRYTRQPNSDAHRSFGTRLPREAP